MNSTNGAKANNTVAPNVTAHGFARAPHDRPEEAHAQCSTERTGQPGSPEPNCRQQEYGSARWKLREPLPAPIQDVQQAGKLRVRGRIEIEPPLRKNARLDDLRELVEMKRNTRKHTQSDRHVRGQSRRSNHPSRAIRPRGRCPAH
jgi:hypothetical protein